MRLKKVVKLMDSPIPAPLLINPGAEGLDGIDKARVRLAATISAAKVKNFFPPPLRVLVGHLMPLGLRLRTT
jgi:hypothetical protein